MATTRRKKKVDPSTAPNVEVYDHVKDEVKYIKSNELTIQEGIFAWVVAFILFIMVAYMFL